jgi:hypothetical protein
MVTKRATQQLPQTTDMELMNNTHLSATDSHTLDTRQRRERGLAQGVLNSHLAEFG